jgi:hypothetical protein
VANTELILRPGEPVTKVPVTGLALSARAGVPTIGPITPGSARLRVGMMGVDNIQLGWDLTTAVPNSVCQFNPHANDLNTLASTLAFAAAHDILVVLMVAGSSSGYGGGNGGSWSDSLYQGKLDLIVNHPTAGPAVLAGVAAKRVLIYFGDEPNAPTWQQSSPGGFSPTQWNQAARHCKNRWPGCLTFGRLSPRIHRDGWGPFPGGQVAATYNAIDYGWMQYNASNRKRSEAFSAALALDLAAAATLNMGCALSVNMVNAGLYTTLDGVTACWDYNFNGASSGIKIGSPAGNEVNGNPLDEGQNILCSDVASRIPSQQNIAVSPPWIRKIGERARLDTQSPFLVFWTTPGDVGSAALLNPLVPRRDFIDAFQYADDQGKQRASYIGLRTPKP